jgi:hypothetical protein
MNKHVHYIVHSSALTGLSMLVLGLILSGCGNKTFPKPITQEAALQSPNLQAQVRQNSVELTWSIPENVLESQKDPRYRFSVMRSEVSWENRNCLDCPSPNQQEVQSIDLAHPAPAVFLTGNTMMWLDTAVSPQRAYKYQVFLVDRRNRPLNQSNAQTVKVITPPSPVSGAGTATSQQGILIQWKPPARNIQGQPLQGELQYLVERRAGEGTWERLSQLPIKANSFLDQSVASDRAYDYRVTSMLDFENSLIYGEPSLIQQAKAPDALPPPPPNTVWAIPAKGTLEVQWTESQAKVGGYHVYRREGKEIIRLTASPVQRPPFVDRSVKPNAVYFYAVSAVSAQPDHREGLLSKWAEIRSLSFE